MSTKSILSRRRLLRSAAGIAVTVLLAACGAPIVPASTPSGQSTPADSLSPQPVAKTAVPLRDAKGTITFWHFWGSSVRRNAIRRIVNSFASRYPEVRVNEVYLAFGDIWTKAIEAVKAGQGMPDVLVEDRPQLRERAKQNIDLALGDLAKRDGIDGKGFWPFTWEEAVANGVPYGLPFETDIRVQFFNPAALGDAGLDTATPPRDWDELWTAADKLDKRDEAGALLVAGFHPLFGSVGYSQWAWNNGGDWQDAEHNPTINARPNVEALEWVKKWYDRYGPSWDAFAKSFGQGAADGFMSGKVVLKPDIAGYASFLNFYNPHFETRDRRSLGWGVAAIPPAKGKKPASLSGGFAMSIPRGSTQVDAAWEFAKYAVLVGQAGWARDTYSMPTVVEMARSDPDLTADPNWKFFVDAMSYGRPAVYNPYYPTMLDVVDAAQTAVLSGKATPQQALDDAQVKAEAEVAKNRK